MSEQEFKTFTRISPEDIYEGAKLAGLKITKKQAKEIFDDFDETKINCELSFWSNIEALVTNYLELNGAKS